MPSPLSKMCLLSLLAAHVAVGCYPIPPETTEGVDSGAGYQGNATHDAGTSSNSAGDAAPTASADAGSTDAASYPTDSWSAIYLRYLASGSTLGHCSNPGCHAPSKVSGVLCDTAANCYTTLKSAGYINGTTSKLVDANSSPLSWFNANAAFPMPQDGQGTGDATAAVTDMQAWAAAGALSN